MLRRYSGSLIVTYDRMSLVEMVLPLDKLEGAPQGTPQAPLRARVAKTVEGQRTHFLYYVGNESSPLEVVRSYQQEIKSQGGRILFECKEATCGGSPSGNVLQGQPGMLSFLYPSVRAKKSAQYANVDYCAMDANVERLHYSTVELAEGRGLVAVAAYVAQGRGNCDYVTGGTFVSVDLLDTAPRKSRMGTVNSAEMANALQGSGKVALYGIYFDFDKTEVKPESDATLEQIAKLMKEKPGLELLVVGHTDNVGSLAANMELSQRRATSVVRALSSRYGVKEDRLTALGVSYAAPLAPNKTEQGRAKNRRVELVEQ